MPSAIIAATKLFGAGHNTLALLSSEGRGIRVSDSQLPVGEKGMGWSR